MISNFVVCPAPFQDPDFFEGGGVRVSGSSDKIRPSKIK